VIAASRSVTDLLDPDIVFAHLPDLSQPFDWQLLAMRWSICIAPARAALRGALEGEDIGV
jgi:hypothetical protein